ncbi:uncharacterized protein [Heptranchias perlo]|uniref:uncharacterized protein isoform X2 n=1 Tax=Heptranchias perlo TaxID=212740 RepID=UPI00355A372E
MVDSSSAVSADQANKSKNDTAHLPTAPGACKIQPPQADSSWQREEKNALNRCLSIIEHLAANLIWKDKTKLNNEPAASVQDALSALFSDYYIVEEVSNLSLFDFLTAVGKYASSNRLIAVFGHILCGKLDAVVLRYIVLMAELVNCVSWQFVSDFQMFVSVVYSLQDDEMKTMMRGYLSFSEKRISKTLVMEYILNLILTNSEPLFEECEANLLQHSGTEPGYLTSTEFALAFENIAPLCNAKLRQVLVEHSIAAKQSASISLPSAAQITAYLILLQEVHQERLQTIPGKGRSSLLLAEPALKSTCEVVPEDGRLITMSRLKLLANNIARRKKIQLAYANTI